MKVLVTGAKGQLGQDLMNELAKRGIEAVGVDVQEMDITDADACRPCNETGVSRRSDPLRCIYCSRCSGR